jgi:transposase, IS5 family
MYDEQGTAPQMRNSDSQFALSAQPISHDHATELEKISDILDANPRVFALVAQDLVRGLRNPDKGAPGLTGEQVLRILIAKQLNGWSYDDLSFHLADSTSYRSFCRLPAFDPPPKRSTLAENLKKLERSTLEAVNREVVRHAVALKVEDGKRVRGDATVTETNIHRPTDSSLLFDGVRVLTRLLGRAREHVGAFGWSDHTKRAKRRSLEVLNARNAEVRTAAYTDLLIVTRKTCGYAEHAVEALRAAGQRGDAVARVLADEIEDKLLLVRAVIDQTERRVLYDEAVPAAEKIVSIFEEDTDIIVKDRRETYYGHKVYLAGGGSGLITDCFIAEGNPADSDQALPLLRRHIEAVGMIPAQAAMDGGFASKQNLQQGKELGIMDLAFSKKRGLEVEEMTSSAQVYRRLRDFRAGIEGLISFLKRSFGLGRCTWRGRASFGTYVMGSVVAANVLMLARLLPG